MSPDTQKIIDERSLLLHELSLDANTETACYGRLSKELLPVLEAGINSEAERGTKPDDLVCAFARFTTGLVVSLAAYVSKPGHEIFFMGDFIKVVEAEIARACVSKQFQEMAKQNAVRA